MDNEFGRIWKDWAFVEIIGISPNTKVYKAIKESEEIIQVSAIKIANLFMDLEENNGNQNNRLLYCQDSGSDTSMERKVYISRILRASQFPGNHNLLRIQDYREIKDIANRKCILFIRMEFLQNLDDYLIEKQILTEKEICRIGLNICDALMTCIRERLFPPEIKPSNIFVTKEGEFKLDPLRIPGYLREKGSIFFADRAYEFVSPDVINNNKIDDRAEIYSLGLLLYFLSNANRMPFLNAKESIADFAEREAAFFRRMKGERLLPPFQGSASFIRVILKACSYDPSNRYKSIEDFYDAIKNVSLKESGDSPD